jgi:hypothetical protein
MSETDTAAKTSLELDNWEKIQFFNGNRLTERISGVRLIHK